MKIYLAIIIIIVLVPVFWACKTQKKTAGGVIVQPLALEIYAKERFGDNYELLYNSNLEYVVIYTFLSNGSSDAFPTLKYDLLKIENNELLFNDIVPGGKIKWNSDHEIEVTNLINIPNPEEEFKGPKRYRYDVIKRVKYDPDKLDKWKKN